MIDKRRLWHDEMFKARLCFNDVAIPVFNCFNSNNFIERIKFN